jgi:hypothetical protein
VNLSRQAVRSLGRVKIGRRTLYVLPIRGVIYGAISLVSVFVLLLVIDRLVLGSLERAGWTSGEQWKRHNQIVEENHRRKTTTEEGELRHWNGEPLPSGKERTILVLGDSFVWGPPYVTLNHLWWRQLAIELERRGYHEVRVVAVGQPGWSTRRQLECARKLVPEVKPDLIVWGYVTNDPDEKIVRQIFDSQDQPPYGQRIRRRLKSVLPNVMFKFESLRADKLAEQYAGPEYGYAYADWELKLVEGKNFEKYRETVGEVGEFLKEAGVPAFLQTLPHFPSREYFEARYEPVMREWQAAGVTVHDSLNEFVRRYGDVSAVSKEALAWGINPGDSHPGPQATHFLAAQTADFIEQKWPQMLGAKDTRHVPDLAINDWQPADLNVRQTSESTFELDYPNMNDRMPQLPAPPAAVVALRDPLQIVGLGITGSGLQQVRIWGLLQPEEKFESEVWHELLPADSEGRTFLIPASHSPFVIRRVSALRIAADVRGRDRLLRLTIFSGEHRLSPHNPSSIKADE